MKTAAGTLLYRKRGNEIEVLIVHASGNYNAKAPWSIPKGEVEPDEELEAAARRETLEETGVVAGTLEALGYVDLPSRKRVHCFAGEAPAGCTPRLASWEIDRAEFVSLNEARRRLHFKLAEFIPRLEELLFKK